jgi:hypothetical protein
MSDEVFTSLDAFLRTATSLERLKSMVIDRGISPNFYFRRRYFIHTATRKRRTECVAFLLEHKAHVDSIDKYDGKTALHIAACHDYVGIIKLLLQYEANIESETIDGKTPLMSAIQCYKEEAANVLIHAGARIYTQSKIPWIEDLRLRRIHAVRTSTFAFIICSKRTKRVHKDIIKRVAQMIWANRWDTVWKRVVTPWGLLK